MLQTTFPATLRAHRFFIPLQLLPNGPEHTQKVLYQFQVFSFLKLIKLKAFFHFFFFASGSLIYCTFIILHCIQSNLCILYLHVFCFYLLVLQLCEILTSIVHCIFNYLPKSSVIFCITYVLMLYSEFYI